MSKSRLVASILLWITVLSGPARSQRGGWSFLPPQTLGDRTDLFYGVDGTATDDVWAVGFREPPDSDRRSLIEHFDGASWTALPLPPTGPVGPFESMHDVVAASRDHALAVGSYTPVGSTAQPLAMEWNGAEWELISSPVFEGGGVFRAVGQTPSGEIWAAGFRFGMAFIARRNGGGWDVEFAPPVDGRNRFYAIHAFSDDAIWLAGMHGAGQGDFRILIQRYDGNSSWTSFDIPTPGWMDSLTGILAFGADDVWATGYYYHPQLFHMQPLVMHYDGLSWTQVQLPEYPEGSAELRDMTATAPDDVYAAGTYATAEGVPRPFVLRYDGATWSDVVLPETGGSHEWFRGMGATPDGDVWAVGQYYDGSSTEPMAFRKSGATASVAEGRHGAAPRQLPAAVVPNPFRSETSVRFGIDQPGPVRLRVWDAAGRLVRTLVDRQIETGTHVVRWDGRDTSGQAVSAGVYFSGLEIGGQTARQKMIRIR